MKKLKRYILICLGLILSLQSYGSKSLFTTHVTITTYNAVRSQCDRSPLITADGTKIDHRKVKSGEQRIVAISRDLLYAIPLGSLIYVEGHGYYEVRDTMNSRFKHRIDILQHSSKKNFKKDKIKIKLVRKPIKKNKDRRFI
mgnify:CR=1 FL=1